ncbi:MAG TPA: PQQ-binding-like beta-propeller repeat protein [Caulifigura sp.]|nr:PQQ-binding-like beta-propeller repeat protein [Caulifigura sp.]
MSCFVFATNGLAENWPTWRGPSNGGISSEKGIPTEWTQAKENIAWRLELPGPSGATPAIWDDRIYLSSAQGDDLVLMCVSTAGKELWKKVVTTGNKQARAGEGNSASPSPSTDGKHVWCFFGNGILCCYDRDGKEVWKFDVQERYGKIDIQFGMTMTPVLHGDHLYLQLIHGTWGGPYIVGKVIKLNKKDGSEVWAVNRETGADDECKHSYASPILYDFDGTQFLVTHGANHTIGYDLDTGRELWRIAGLNGPSEFNKNQYDNTFRLVASPGVAAGTIVIPTCKKGPAFAFKVNDALIGTIAGPNGAFRWAFKSTPDVPCPLIKDGLVYLCMADGRLACIDLESGEQQYFERAHNAQHRSSPLYVDGHIYLAAKDGAVTVVKAGPKYEVVAENSMNGEGVTASPIVSNGTLYIRSAAALYAIKAPK